MKHKISITIEEDILLKVFDRMRKRDFRNKSHFFEEAASRMLDRPGGDAS
ncbi:hypothetical protein GF345_00435 [Candidatus Woesearchaeota archaeon]|nr:hypothetical protein [Candidatus Woesearchaeota archaeon]MBD3312887.1 hypothetical protein [Candidatus Woesearchaeota archaeon]